MLAPEITGKRLELLKETVPNLSRVAVLVTSTEPGYAQTLQELQLAAKALRLQLQFIDVLGSKEIEPAFRKVSKERTDGILVLNSAVFISQRKQITAFGANSRPKSRGSARCVVAANAAAA